MKRISISPPVAALILAVILFLLSGLLPNGYGSDVDVAIAQATNIVRLAVFLGIIAAGQTLVIISGSEGIDLSAGSVVTLTAILTYVLVSGNDDKVLLALLVSFAVGAVIGLLNGAGITFLKISPFVMTLGMAGVVTGAIIVINHGNVSGKVVDGFDALWIVNGDRSGSNVSFKVTKSGLDSSCFFHTFTGTTDSNCDSASGN